jgi:hypothetical protein
MVIGESTQFNVLVNWVLGLDSPMGPVTEEQAKEAAMWLADRAHKPVGAGLTSERVEKRWAEVQPRVIHIGQRTG